MDAALASWLVPGYKRPDVRPQAIREALAVDATCEPKVEALRPASASADSALPTELVRSVAMAPAEPAHQDFEVASATGTDLQDTPASGAVAQLTEIFKRAWGGHTAETQGEVAAEGDNASAIGDTSGDASGGTAVVDGAASTSIATDADASDAASTEAPATDAPATDAPNTTDDDPGAASRSDTSSWVSSLVCSRPAVPVSSPPLPRRHPCP